MDKLIEKTMAINEEHNDNYSQVVPLNLNLKDADYVDSAIDVPIEYEIQIDHRSWGIKGIDVFIRGGIDAEVEVEERVVPIKVDFLDVSPKINWLEGRAYVPAEVHVSLNADFTVESVEIDFYYLVP